MKKDGNKLGKKKSHEKAIKELGSFRGAKLQSRISIGQNMIASIGNIMDMSSRTLKPSFGIQATMAIPNLSGGVLTIEDQRLCDVVKEKIEDGIKYGNTPYISIDSITEYDRENITYGIGGVDEYKFFNNGNGMARSSTFLNDYLLIDKKLLLNEIKQKVKKELIRRHIKHTVLDVNKISAIIKSTGRYSLQDLVRRFYEK